MMKNIAIFKNPRTGSFYTADSNKVFAVYLPRGWWERAPKKVAKNGSEFIIAYCVELTNKYGNPYYKIPNKQ